MIVPAAAAARAIATSPSGSTRRWKATGATSSGIEICVPSTVVAVLDLADVDEHARPQSPAREGSDVVAQRALVAGAAGEVAVHAGIELLGGQPLVVGDVDRVRRWHGPTIWRSPGTGEVRPAAALT